MRSLALLAALLLALPAAAAERDVQAESVAEEAHRVRDEFCSTTAGRDTTLATRAVAEVSTVWAQVSEELDRSKKVYLLYWRGVLAECLSQEERAIEDLSNFVASQEGRSLWQSLVDDAKNRLQRLTLRTAAATESTRAGPPPPGAVLGIALGSSAGAVGGLAGWQWAEAELIAVELYTTPHSGDDLRDRGNEGDAFQRNSRILVGTSVGLGVASLTSLIITGATANSTRTASLPPTFAFVPTQDGAQLVLGGRF